MPTCMTATTAARIKDVRVPYQTRAQMSRPTPSVPKGCSALMGRFQSLADRDTEYGSMSEIIGYRKVNATSSVTTISMTRMSGLFKKVRSVERQ